MANATGSLAQARSTLQYGGVPGVNVLPETFFVPVASGQTVYQGSLIVLNPSGLAQPAGSATGIIVGRMEPGLGGVSSVTSTANSVTYATGANGITVREGCFLWNIAAGQTVGPQSFGALVYAYNDNTITPTAGVLSIAGVCVGLDSATQSQAMVLTTCFTSLL